MKCQKSHNSLFHASNETATPTFLPLVILKVGWTSNNHGGGYVRLALVPESQKDSHEAYVNNVLKVVCYGHDQRPGMFRFGDCKHPCNARPGCQYQSGKSLCRDFHNMKADHAVDELYNFALSTSR